MTTPTGRPSAAAVMTAYFGALLSGDFASLDSLFADDVIWHQPGGGQLSGDYRGKQSLFGLFGRFMQLSGGTFQITEVGDVMVNGSLVAASLRFGAARGDDRIDMPGVDLMRIVDGKIQEVWLFSGDQATEDAFWSGAA